MTLSADETRHLREVLRLTRGDEVYIFDGVGREFRFVFRKVTGGKATLDLLAEVEPARPESQLNFTLCVALSKGEKFDLVVQKTTEIGVSRLVPLTTARASVRLRDPDNTTRKTERWRRIVIEACKQSGRARLMEIDAPVAFDTLVKRGEGNRELRLMFAESGGGSFAEMMLALPLPPKAVTAAVGPDGGWTNEEMAQGRAASWKLLTLGGRTLRA